MLDKAIRMIFKETPEVAPDTRQTAISSIAISVAQRKGITPQVHVVGAGQGKSRIAATIVLLGLKNKIVKKAYIVFTHQRLLEKDKADFDNFWTVAGLKDKVEYRVGIDFEPESGSLLVIDEADELIFNNAERFCKLAGNFPTVSLTATSGGDVQGGAEG
jgi:hypothetical protein